MTPSDSRERSEEAVLDRRDFHRASALAGAAFLLGGRPDDPIRATVLEHPDRWTDRAVGLATYLERAGAEVLPLDPARPATAQPGRPQLIAFGSFTNNGDVYRQYLARHGTSLARFVARGGVVLEMTQSDQFGASVAWLPEGMEARRGDRDLHVLHAIDPEHPLVRALFPPDRSRIDDAYVGHDQANWESFERTQGLRVLAASAPNGSSPCLLEGAHGKGRVLLASLWLDKGFDREGRPRASERNRTLAGRFFAAVVQHVRAVTVGRAPEVVPTPSLHERSAGPMIGHVDHRSARIWFGAGSRAREGQVFRCQLEGGGRSVQKEARAHAARDRTMVFPFDELAPDTPYEVRIAAAGVPEEAGVWGRFRTAPDPDHPARVVLGLGSCAPSTPDPVWTRVLEEGCEGFVFLGDTPYIDSSDLKVAREKHREFLVQPEISRLIASVPCWGTWDDHDFGRNDGHGDFEGKGACRRAFVEYRANATFGHDRLGRPLETPATNGEGIYTSFRRGPLEVFLLDPRWFSRTERSFADPEQPTCLGAVQWRWFRKRLLGSTATFKAITTGMIWDDKTNREKDDWHTYRHEREAIFDLIRDENVPGCFLIGGDIHVSRALNYGPQRVGYPLWQFIVSPLHAGVIERLDVPHPALVHHAAEPHTFLKLVCDSTEPDPVMEAIWINRAGRELFRVSLRASDLEAH